MTDPDEELLRELGALVRTLGQEDGLARDQHASGYEPLPPDIQARMVASVVAATCRPRVTTEPEPEDASVSAPAPRSAQPVSRFRSMHWMSSLAAAAAVALALLWPRKEPSAPLPSYAVEVAGAAAEMRGSDVVATARPRLDASTRLLLTLRPATEVSSEVGVAVFANAEDGSVIRWPAAVERAASGALRVQLEAAPVAAQYIASASIFVGTLEQVAQGEAGDAQKLALEFER